MLTDVGAAAPILDSHVHFWDPATLCYPWLARVPAIHRAFGPDALAAARGDAPVGRVLFVEGNATPRQTLDEVAFASRFTDADPAVAGIVAFADLASGTAAATLGTFAELPIVCGVRQNIQGEAPGFCLSAPFVRGVQEVGRRGLVFDLCATHDQLGDVLALVDACGDTRFVLDHCGKPPIRDGGFDVWARHVARLAEREHVCCKLSGLLTEAAPNASHADLAPYAEHVVACFGVERVLYGSDWPVLTLAGSYRGWYEFTTRLTIGWSAAERRAFFHDNAVRVYAL